MSDKPPPPPSPPASGSEGSQTQSTEVVDHLPEKLERVGGIQSYPVTSLISDLRNESPTFRGEVPWALLQSQVQIIEHQAISERSEKNSLQEKLSTATQQVTDLSVENAVLKQKNKSSVSESKSKTAMVTLGALGVGLSFPFAVSDPSASSIVFLVLFGSVLSVGLWRVLRKDDQ